MNCRAHTSLKQPQGEMQSSLPVGFVVLLAACVLRRKTATRVRKENMGLGCLYKALLMPLESKSCPAFLLHTQVPGTQPGSPSFCLQLSFRPPSKFLFYTALPGTPTVPKLSPHYSTVYKCDLIFMPEYELLGPLPLCKACAGTGSRAAAAGNLADWHCVEAAQTNMAIS